MYFASIEEISLSVISIHSSSGCQGLDGVGGGCLGYAVGTQRVHQNTGAVAGTAGYIACGDIHSTVDILGGDVGDGCLVQRRIAHDHFTGGVGGSQGSGCVVIRLCPVVHDDAAVGNIGGIEVIVDGKCAVKGYTGGTLVETAGVGEDTHLALVCRRDGRNHGGRVAADHCLLFGGQAAVRQRVGLVTEVGLSCRAVVQHSDYQCLQLGRLVGVAQCVGGIGLGAVVIQLGVAVGAVLQLGIDFEVDGIAQFLCRNALSSTLIVAGFGIIAVAGNDVLSIFSGSGCLGGGPGHNAHFGYAVQIGSGEVDVHEDIVLKGEGNVMGGDGWLGNSGYIAQSKGVISVVHQSEGDFNAAGDKELIGIGQGACMIQGSGGGFVAQPAIGHVPVLIIAGFDRNIAVTCEGSREFAVYKFVCTQIGVIFITGIICTVDVAEEVVVFGGLFLAALGADAAGIAVTADCTAGGASSIDPIVRTAHGTDGADVIAPVMAAGGAAGRALSVAPKMVAQSRSVLKLIDSPGFHFTGGGGSNRGVAPVGVVRPAFVSEEFIISGIFLGINIRNKEPCGISVGAGTAGGFVTHIRFVAVVITGIAGRVVGMENGMGAALAGVGIMIGIRCTAPVIVQIAGVRTGTNCCLYGFRLRGDDSVAILAVKTAGGREAAGPTGDILHTAGTGFYPFTACLSVADQRGLIRGSGLVIGIAVLGLGSEQAAVHACRQVINPAGSQFAGTQLVIVPAVAASELIGFVRIAGSCVGYHVIIMPGCGDSLGFCVAAALTGSGLRAAGGAGSILNRPSAVRVPGCGCSGFTDKAAN